MNKAELSDYFALVEAFPLRPLRSGRDLKKAARVVDGLIGRRRSKNEDAYLEVLGDLIEKYEDLHHPIDSVSAPDMLAHLIEASGKSARRVALEAKIQPSTMSELLSGTRGINIAHIRKLAPYFGVEPGVFIQEVRDRTGGGPQRGMSRETVTAL